MLKQFEGTVHGAYGKPLNIAGRTEHLDIQWGEERGRASFIVIVGLESPPCLIGMDIMRPLRVHIDVTNGTATPAQPDPQTIHLNAAQSQPPQTRPPAQIANPPPLLKEEPASGASLPASRTAVPSSPSHQRQENPLVKDRSTALPPPTNLPSAPAEPCPNPSNSHHHLTWLTLILLAVLGCFKQQIFLLRQPALSIVTTHGPLRMSFFALMALSRCL